MAPDNLRVHETGAMRTTDADRERYDLISPIALEALARTYAEGAEKYGEMNWEEGFPVSDLLNHAIRHIYKFLSGDRSEPHLPHALWGLAAAIHSLALWPELNRGLRCSGCVPSFLAGDRSPRAGIPNRPEDAVDAGAETFRRELARENRGVANREGEQ